MRELLSRQRQFLLYLAGGVASALIDVGLMQVLIYSGVGYVAATSAGFIAGLLFNYGYHATVTFTAPPSGRSMARYLTVVAFNYAFTLACVALSVHLLGVAVVGKLLALPVVAINGFILGKHWIFK
ncbi:MAG: GtrA family protein [Telluria sp.]